jgi:hypothetical protein
MNRWVGVLASLVTGPSRFRRVIEALVTPVCRAGRHPRPPGGFWILMLPIGPGTTRPVVELPGVTSPGH